MNKNCLGILVAMLFFSLNLFAQDKQAEMADVLRENGKIYNVVAVVLVILIGLITYLFITERKLSKIENSIKK